MQCKTIFQVQEQRGPIYAIYSILRTKWVKKKKKSYTAPKPQVGETGKMNRVSQEVTQKFEPENIHTCG